MDKQERTINDISGAEFISQFPTKYKLRLEDNYPFSPKLYLEVHRGKDIHNYKLNTDTLFELCSPMALAKQIQGYITLLLQGLTDSKNDALELYSKDEACAQITKHVNILREILNDADTLRAIPDTPF